MRVCASEDLIEGGAGVRFEIEHEGAVTPAFAVRFAGQARAYLNRCAHVGVELDWKEGEFFDSSGLYLICATHGALYGPESGRCVAGPCKGRSLLPLAVREIDGAVLVEASAARPKDG